MQGDQNDTLDAESSTFARRVRGELRKLCDSPQLSSSPKLQQLLTYIVTEALSGNSGQLKAYTIAVEGMGRREDFCAMTDPYIRNLGVRLRRAISDYYLNNPGEADLQILLPKGSYQPQFRESEQKLPVLSGVLDPMVVPRPAEIGLPTGGAHTLAHRVPGAPGLLVHVFDEGQLDPPNSGLGSALAEEIVTEMRRFPNVRLYGPVDDPSFGAGSRSSDEHLDGAVQYVLRGRVRTMGSEVQATLRLLDPLSSECLWAQNYHWPGQASRSAQFEEILVRRVAVTLTDWDGVIPSMDALSGTRGDPEQPLTPYQAALKAHAWGVSLSAAAYEEALRHLKACVAANPDCAITHAILSDLYFSDYLSGIGYLEDGLDLAGSHARRAVALDPASPRAHWALGQVSFARGDLGGFEAEFSKAISLNPNDITIKASFGLYHAGLGESERAMQSFEAARELSGQAPPWAFMIPWLKHYGAGDYAAARLDSESIAMPGLLWGALTSAASLGMSGRKLEAQAAIAELLKLQPEFPTSGHELVGRLIRSPELAGLIFEGLYLAGLDPVPSGLSSAV